MLNQGATINHRNNRGVNPLIQYVIDCNNYNGVEIYRLLLDRWANVNDKDNDGRTALHRAANGEVAHLLLLDRGASIDLKDDHGRTPLFLATEEAKQNHGVEVVNKLVDGPWRRYSGPKQRWPDVPSRGRFKR